MDRLPGTTEGVGTIEEARRIAEEIGFPVALKILSPDITHKSDVGGVILGLDTAKEVGTDADGYVQCTSCHDPHDNINGHFLVITTQNSALCLECHDTEYWTGSSHSTSGNTWSGTTPDPWAHTEYTTVAQNGCENCHVSHNAGGTFRLLKYATEEDNCLDCHNGNVASTNIQAEITKIYRHNVYSSTGVHDPVEATLANTVEPGDKVLVARYGMFSHRWIDMCQRHGLNWEDVFLRPHDQQGIREVVMGVGSTERLRDKYGVTVREYDEQG